MDETEQECVRLLCTLATEILEDVHIVVSAGQSGRPSVRTAMKAAQELRRTSVSLEAIAAAVEVALARKAGAALGSRG